MKDDAAQPPSHDDMESMPREPDASDTVRLRKVWDAEQLRRGRAKVSQKAMALEWGVNPSLITQYLNGHIKLNTEAKLRFARYLGKPLLEIWPKFEFASVAPGELPADAIMIAALFATLPGTAQNAVANLIRTLSGTPAAQ